MAFYIGIDGGGTKTAYVLADETGKILADEKGGGTSYQQIGQEKVASLLKDGILSCTQRAGISLRSVGGTMMALPCYGENPRKDEILKKEIVRALPGLAFEMTNDAEAAWCGALEGKPGINVVAGTGSIGYGRNEQGESARCGGWHEFFSDEGSCYWAGRKAMQLFTMEADGRRARGALYDLFREKFQLQRDLDFAALMAEEYLPTRAKVASLQILLEEAARGGDENAIAIYTKAAHAIFEIAMAIKQTLHMKSGTRISYAGGMFRAGALVLTPLKQLVATEGDRLTAPVYPPVIGALLLAYGQFGVKRPDKIEQRKGT